MFATPPTKKQSPPGPIEPSNEQAMPLGAYYENILIHPQPIPDVKPEEPPKSSTEDLPSEPPRKLSARPPKDDKPGTEDADPNPNPNPPKPPVPTPSIRAGESGSDKPDNPRPDPNPPQPPVPTPSVRADKTTEAKAQIFFSASLSGPAERAERLEAIRSQSRLIAGVLVPPKPEEPDNCCMSGCVNCVWDRFRDEMEMWAVQNSKAERRLRAQEAGVSAATTAASMDAAATDAGSSAIADQEPAVAATSMDDDGGGSSSNWDVGKLAGQAAEGTLTKNFWDEDLYKNVPVGIREFMKQEKRLKEKHLKDGTLGG